MDSESSAELGTTEKDSKAVEALPKVEQPQQLVAKSTEGKEVDPAQQLIKEKQRTDECFKHMMYLQADFDNYRKRVESEVAQLKQFSNEKLVSNLLSVVDELELAIRSAKESKDNELLASGVEMVLKKLQSILGKEGLSRIQAIGSPFDPNVHEAVSKVPIEGKDEGIIIDEVRSGYMLKGKVIRPSMVTIASSTKDSPTELEENVSA